MAASEAAVTAVMETLGCAEDAQHSGRHERPVCEVEHHSDEPWFRERWGLRGCEFAARLADAAVETDFCSRPGRVGVPWHSWRFDDDDSHIICQFCGEMRDSLSGRVIRPAAEGMRANRIEGKP